MQTRRNPGWAPVRIITLTLALALFLMPACIPSKASVLTASPKQGFKDSQVASLHPGTVSDLLSKNMKKDVSSNVEESRDIDWMDLKFAQQKAVEQGKKIMVFVEAEWCGICRRMEREVFTDTDVLHQLRSSYVSVMIDVDSKSPQWFNGEELSVRQLAQQFKVSAVPTLLFVDEDGDVLAHQTGFVPAERMAALLTFIISDSFGRQSLEEYMEER